MSDAEHLRSTLTTLPRRTDAQLTDAAARVRRADGRRTPRWAPPTRRSVFHSWSKQGGLKPLPLAGGQGTTVWDHDGNRYLDFSSQLVFTNMGHQHPKIIAGITEQLNTLATVAPAHGNATRAEAARLILKRAPEGFEKVFFTAGGADANENAIRLARLVTGRDKVLSRYRSYHGNTGAAIVATGDWRRIPNEYATGHVHFFGPFLYRIGVLGEHARGGVRPRAAPPRADRPGRGPRVDRRDPARVRARHRRDHGPAARLPVRRPRDLRPLRHQADPRRGHGRLRAHG